VKTNHKLGLAVLNRWKFKGWMVCVAALVSFAAGSLLTARLMHQEQVRADSNRVFELMIYHTVPGKVGQHLHVPRGASQPGGSEKELASASRRPGVSRV
jgi:hypothetical protein